MFKILTILMIATLYRIYILSTLEISRCLQWDSLPEVFELHVGFEKVDNVEFISEFDKTT